MPFNFVHKDCSNMLYFVCKEEIFLYNCTNNLNLTSTQSHKLTSLDKRVQILTSYGQPAVANKAKRHAIIIVKKMLKKCKKLSKNETCEILDFFEITKHGEKNVVIMVPKFRL